MSLELYLVFVLATALLIATPGPNVALIVGTSLTYGARTGLIAMAGVNGGVMIRLAVVAAGLPWLVEIFSRNFDLIRFIGAGYLLFLGIQTFWKTRKPAARAAVERAGVRARLRGCVRQSEDADLAAVLPQFLSDGAERQ